MKFMNEDVDRVRGTDVGRFLIVTGEPEPIITITIKGNLDIHPGQVMDFIRETTGQEQEKENPRKSHCPPPDLFHAEVHRNR